MELHQTQAQEREIEVNTYFVPFSQVDRAIADGEKGFVKVHVNKGTDKILGATIIARHAGEMIWRTQPGNGRQLGTGNNCNGYPTVSDPG